MDANGDDDWTEVWEARLDTISSLLGRPYNNVYHAPHPFQLGGNADVVAFPIKEGGIAYVTSELTGKPESCYADYELMICHREATDWGPNIISRLAPYTQQARIAMGESMDIDAATPPESRIKAFLFDTYGSFELFGEYCELRLCIGITKDELQHKLEHGPDALLTSLKAAGIYPFTDLERNSIPLTLK